MLRSFFDRPVLEVAPDLLGALLIHEQVVLRITEVEAYDGANDPASHAYRGPTKRNAVMFGPPGHLYVYFTYGMHYCANFVCGPPDVPSGILLRAGEIVGGIEIARSRRPGIRPDQALARGPANLVRALGLGPANDGADVCGDGPITVEPAAGPAGERLRTGPRVGVRLGAERPWRFWLADEPSVSAYRPAAVRESARQSITGGKKP